MSDGKFFLKYSKIFTCEADENEEDSEDIKEKKIIIAKFINHYIHNTEHGRQFIREADKKFINTCLYGIGISCLKDAQKFDD